MKQLSKRAREQRRQEEIAGHKAAIWCLEGHENPESSPYARAFREGDELFFQCPYCEEVFRLRSADI